MTQIIDITELKDLSELKTYAKAQFSTLQLLNEQVRRLETENNHLKTLLDASVSKIEINIPIERLICEMQIKQIYDQSATRSLTLEETKRLDLLVKNLYLSKGQATEIVDNKPSITNSTPDEELIRIIKGT